MRFKAFKQLKWISYPQDALERLKTHENGFIQDLWDWSPKDSLKEKAYPYEVYVQDVGSTPTSSTIKI